MLNTIFSLPTPEAIKNLFPSYLRLWEILLNQKYDADFIQSQINELGTEEAATQLIQNLIDLNSINIYHPETDEIIWEL